MTDGTDGRRPQREENSDTGEPVVELATLTAPVPTGFSGRLHRRIDRRTLANNALAATWHFPIIVALEFLTMIFELLGIGDKSDKGDSR
ncbi:MAG: hypothetical protein OEV00_13500 [Acidobacteriota bacterium]|nr:hypothetical protein [Acidobacteriota bacterium]MDH3786326.1 hypothetical protein [Acidobacteriota bacterium]